jgi:outer membrane protein assembly factor BamE
MVSPPVKALIPRKGRYVLLASLLIALAGCGLIYKQTIPQGNLLEQSTIDQLEPGMSKRQVALILGTPAVLSPFDQERWDYIYSYKVDDEPAQIKNLSLSFDDGRLSKIEGDFKPGGDGVVFKPEDALIEATREYQRELRAAKEEREKSQRSD